MYVCASHWRGRLEPLVDGKVRIGNVQSPVDRRVQLGSPLRLFNKDSIVRADEKMCPTPLNTRYITAGV